MRVETNVKRVRRNRQIAQYLFWFSLGILVLGLFLTNQQAAAFNNPNEALLLGGVLPAVVVVIAFVSTIASVRMTNQWIREPRPERALAEGLKGLSNKAVLYNYFHGPARHVLIAPQGVYVLTTRWQNGAFEVHGDRWTTRKSLPARIFTAFRFDNIGNPSAEAVKNADYVKALLQPIAPDVPVFPVVVFTDPGASILIDNPTVPVLRAQDKLKPNLRDYMRDVGRQPTLTPEQIAAFEKATLPQA